MEQQYSAFISYRHAPADIAVAKEIQRRLEHFHVPGSIRKKTGKKSIGRVFRDKEELPITSDLNQDISRALESAEYLIVICSTSTKESVWVAREIECFLKNHSKRQILTVLVDGEPYDVIPKVLLEDTVTRQAADGSSYEETVSYEPLSCDYRMSRKEANREELPRLAAVLLGCGYDELVRRQRQYVIRRLTAVMSVTFVLFAAVLAYYIWSNREIRKNYMRSLENESLYLTREAEQLLSEGDVPGAAYKLMEALPGGAIEGSTREQINRPMYPEAQLRLEEALNLYQSGAKIDQDFDLTVHGVIRPEADISGIFPDPKGELLFGAGNDRSIYVWETGSNRQLHRFSLSDSVKCFDQRLFLGEDRMVVCDTYAAYCWNYRTGELCWNTPAMGMIKEADLAGETQLFLLTDTFLVCLDAGTGEITDRRELNMEGWNYYESAGGISADGSQILLSLRNEEATAYALASLDTGTGMVQILEEQDHSYYHFTPMFDAGNGEQAVAFVTTDAEDVFRLRVISAKSGALIWEQTYDAYLLLSRGYTYTHAAFVPSLAVFDGAEKNQPYLILCLLDRTLIIDARTGNDELEMPTEGRGAYVWTEDGGYMIVTTSGMMYRGNEHSIQSKSHKVFPESFAGFTKLPGQSVCYCLFPSGEIKEYRPGEGDSRYAPIGETELSSAGPDTLRINERWAVWAEYDSICWLDKESGSFGQKMLTELWETVSESSESYQHRYKLRKINENTAELYDYLNDGSNNVFYNVRLNLETGACSAEPLFRVEGYLLDGAMQYVPATDTLYLLFQGDFDQVIRSYCFENGEYGETRFRLDTKSSTAKSMVISADGRKAMLADQDYLYLHMVDLVSGEVFEKIDISFLDRAVVDNLGDSDGYRLQDAWDGQHLILPDGEQLHVYDEHGREIAAVLMDSRGQQEWEEKELLPQVQLSPDGKSFYSIEARTLYRYDLRTGQMTGSAALGDPLGISVLDFEAQWYFPEDDQGRFFIQDKDELYEIWNGETIGVLSHIGSVSLFDREESCVYISDYIPGDVMNYRWGRFPICSLEEILQIAKEKAAE